MELSEKDMERSDWQLLRNAAVTLFWNQEHYSRTISSLRDLKYQILDFKYEEYIKFCGDVSKALKWNEQFGYSPWTGNLDAFNDGLRGEPYNSGDYAVVCVSQFHKCVKDNPTWATSFLDILEYQSRNYLLSGKRLIILIQTDDANYFCEKLGGRHAQWNMAEWMNSSRGK